MPPKTKPKDKPNGKSKTKQRGFVENKLHKLNSSINFRRESTKTNARKRPTQVICISCRNPFILPFKPRKPEVYCDKCFKKIKK